MTPVRLSKLGFLQLASAEEALAEAISTLLPTLLTPNQSGVFTQITIDYLYFKISTNGSRKTAV